MGAADDDPFAEAMGEASKRSAQVDQAKFDIQHNQDEATLGREVADDDGDEDLDDQPEEDEKQRRLKQTLATGDAIEEVSTFSGFCDSSRLTTCIPRHL